MSTDLKHIAFIVDGNRRWARKINQTIRFGHQAGYDKTIHILNHCHSQDINTVTFWLFSTENWRREAEEVKDLMELLYDTVYKHTQNALKNHIRITHLGRKNTLPEKLLQLIAQAEEQTEHFDKKFVNLAIDYGGHDEILRAAQKVSQKQLEYTTNNLENNLDTAGLESPNPDLIVRTAGEIRMSGFMSWQSAYSEFIFTDKYFPALEIDDINIFIEEFHNRVRRFGGK